MWEVEGGWGGVVGGGGGGFFFQAEDGIRDDLVTGVQTCALPIFAAAARNGQNKRQGAAATRNGQYKKRGRCRKEIRAV